MTLTDPHAAAAHPAPAAKEAEDPFAVADALASHLEDTADRLTVAERKVTFELLIRYYKARSGIA